MLHCAENFTGASLLFDFVTACVDVYRLFSMPVISFYLAIFAATTVAQFALGITYRRRSLRTGTLRGCALEILSYVVRIQLHYNDSLTLYSTRISVAANKTASNTISLCPSNPSVSATTKTASHHRTSVSSTRRRSLRQPELR